MQDRKLNKLTGVLPPDDNIITHYLEWACQTSHAPALFHLGAILPVLAHQIAVMGYQIPTSFQEGALALERPRLWSLIVGGTAHGKSTGYVRARSFFEGTDTAPGFLRCIDQHIPPPFIGLGGGSTVQGVTHELSEHFNAHLNLTPGIVYVEEFARLLLRDDVSYLLCELYDQRDIARHQRQLQKAVLEHGNNLQNAPLVKNPTVSAVFCAATASLQRVTRAEHMEGGLFNRMIWFYDKIEEEDISITEDMKPRVRSEAISYWLGWHNFITKHDNCPDGDDCQDCWGFANRKLIAWADPPSMERILAHELLDDRARKIIAKSGRLGGFYLRAIGHAKTIAAIYAFASGRWLVLERDLLAAARLMKLCLSNLETLESELGVDPKVSLRNQLLNVVTEAGEFGIRQSELYSRLNITTKQALYEALEPLLEEGKVVSFLGEKGHKGPQPRIVMLMKHYVTRHMKTN